MHRSQRSWSLLLDVVLLLCIFAQPALMVKHEQFKTCPESGFCKRNREYADDAEKKGSSWVSPYVVDPASLKLVDGVMTGNILKTINPASKETVNLPLTIAFLESGAARVTVDEERRQKGDIELRHDRKCRKERYNDLDQWVIAGGLDTSKGAAVKPPSGQDTTTVIWGSGKHEAVIRHNPFYMEFRRDGETHVRFNERGLMNVEHWRKHVEKPEGQTSDGGEEGQEEQPDPEATWWDEWFGGNSDSKPRGPESVGLDISFPGYQHVYGIPEHTGPLSLRETRGKKEEDFDEPYRLYNADVFEYIANSPMTLYGAINYMQAHKKDSTVGVFWMNAAELWVDIVKAKSTANALSLGITGKTDTQTHWFSESGLLDVFVFLGPTPEAMSKQWADLTGYTTMPAHFSIGYHQCRWNYVTDEDVKDVDRKLDKYNIPYDVIWLDLEYADDRKYFTWEPLTFKDPIGMQEQLKAHDRKLVVLVDPHIKKKDDYYVYKELIDKDLAIKNKDLEAYDGWCWPGSSHWVDCFNPAAIKWWKTLFKYDKFKGSTTITHIWNDMNEPSVFNGPEGTMPKDNIHHGGWEHRDVHNVNGLTFHNATFQALLDRDSAKKTVDIKRPFVLTRAFFAGSQRSAAMWTGDNQASWEHLKESLPMILSLGISGYPFTGADVGGFFGNPSWELLTRWYQAGAFYPFFRAHAHIDTRRREPYLAGEPYTGIITQAIRLRYQLLPAWYTAFHTAATQGLPIVRPNWYVFPADERGFAIDDQMYIGSTGLLVKPVTEEEGNSVDVYMADSATYFDYFDYSIYAGSAGRTQKIRAPLDKIPLLMRAGHIIPRKDRPRRSSGLMKWDPYTLVAVLETDSGKGSGVSGATGELYVDDGDSYEFEDGAYIHRNITLLAPGTEENGGTAWTLMSVDIGTAGKATAGYLKRMEHVTFERIIVVNPPAAWRSLRTVKIAEEGRTRSSAAPRDLDLDWHDAEAGKAAWAVVKNPNVSVGARWRIEFA